MSRLVQADKSMVTQITTFANSAEQKSISEAQKHAEKNDPPISSF